MSLKTEMVVNMGVLKESEMISVGKLSNEPDAIKNSIAGSFSGVTRVLVGQPFDTVKVRMQSQSVSSGVSPQYKSSLDCLQKIVKNEGVLSFYKGTLSPLVVVGICASIQFSVAEHVKGEFRKMNGTSSLELSQVYMAGSVAGVANSFINGPIEHIRTRLQLQTHRFGKEKPKDFNNPLDALKKIYQRAGIKGVFKGQTITTFRELQAYGGLFMTYEWARRQIESFTGTNRKDFSPAQIALAGAISGYGMWIPIFPLDSIKSKIQSDSLGNDFKYKGIFDCAKQIMKTEGIKGFFKGFGPCMLRAAPVNATIFLTFENVMRLMN